MSVLFQRAAAGLCGLALLVCLPSVVRALEPDEIALVVNAKVPAGRQLAESYARQRHIPDGRIIEIDLDPGNVDSPAEEIDYRDYQPRIAQPIRDFLLQNHLNQKVKCLVTFWGVPLRIRPWVLTDAEKDEQTKIQDELKATLGDPQSPDRGTVIEQVRQLEAMAASLVPDFRPPTGDDIAELSHRVDVAINVIVSGLNQSNLTRTQKAKALTSMLVIVERLVGTDRVKAGLLTQPNVARLAAHVPDPQEVAELTKTLKEQQAEIDKAENYNPTPEEREKARTIAHKYFGLIQYAFVLNAEADAFRTDDTGSSVDSELSLLWPRRYPRYKWLANQLAYKFQALLRQRGVTSSSLMVTRLDGSTVQTVDAMISTSIKVESEGLRGLVALDARGRPQLPPEQWDDYRSGADHYSIYDQSIRNLANALKQKTRLDVVFDDKDPVFEENSLKDIAIYCGWYSLRHYVRPGSFAPGAIGFHVASGELVSLRTPNEPGWGKGLLTDGVVATIGPVAEPYLESFPFADEFFPLLMTGRLTLAEVYWRTTPMVSWMQVCIGDPLYNPYKTDPPMRVADLPPALQAAVLPPPATRPATAPAVP